jgi:hypothetical protein
VACDTPQTQVVSRRLRSHPGYLDQLQTAGEGRKGGGGAATPILRPTRLATADALSMLAMRWRAGRAVDGPADGPSIWMRPAVDLDEMPTGGRSEC